MLEDSTTKNKVTPKPASVAETKPLFRADTDQNGDWYVWHRLGFNGWATMRRCEGQDQALQLADHLNADPKGSILHG